VGISTYQSRAEPAGQFDFLDSQIEDIKGGEVVVFDTVDVTSGDLRAPDVYGDTVRVVARKALSSDIGPFFLVESHANAGGVSTISREVSSLVSTSVAHLGYDNVSGKLSLHMAEGLYAISTDVVDSATINATTPPNTRLYTNDSGLLTTTPSQTAAIIGFFVEFRDNAITNGFPQPFIVAGTNRQNSTAIIYKSNADGYLNLDISAIAEAIGGAGRIGDPTDGTYLDGYAQTLTPGTTIADAVDILNESLLGVSVVANSNEFIGNPTDGTYTDGFFPFTPGTTTANAVDDINELLLAIAPAKPGDLTGQTLALSGATIYSAILPSGLSAAWYSGGDIAGGTVASYIVDNTYLLDSPAQASSFNGGVLSDPSQLGTVTHVLDGADSSAHDATTGTGTTGSVTVDDISVYNTIWNKINAEIAVTQAAEGRQTHAMRHTLAGTSNTSEFFLDDINTTPSFDVALSVSENIIVDGYLSGIIHYASGSTFLADFTLGSGIFQKAYHPTAVAQLSGPAMSTSALNPGSVPAVADTFSVTSSPITLSVANVARETHTVTATGQKPDGTSQASTAPLTRPVNTYGTASTSTTESFVDEAQRLVLGTTTAWTSSAVLIDGNAQVYISGSNGALSFARPADYSFSGDQVFERFFTKASASNGTLTFAGISASDIDALGIGNTNIFIELEAGSPRFFDLGRAVGDNSNGTGTGDSVANSMGGRVSVSGNDLNFSLLTNSTGGSNNNRYRVRIVFRDTTDTINSIVSS